MHLRAYFNITVLAALLLLSAQTSAIAQDTGNKKLNLSAGRHGKHKTGSIYGSWGYNEEWYTKSTIHIKQNAIGDNYDLEHVKANDHKGWDNGILNKALTIPQYNYRLGYYFNDKQDLALELNFDHTKYVVIDGEDVHIVGVHSGVHVDQHLIFSQQNGFYYYLNNGANFFLFNIVKRLGLYQSRSRNLLVDLTGKAGVGPVIPHVQNSLFGHPNDQGFQFGGWNTGLETALRVTFMKYAYIEFSQKVDYARYSNLKLYEGTARQNFGCYELILSIGAVIPTTKHNPRFHPEKKDSSAN
jgi:opacity protein-like surface antigen